jgi:PAS domain S-box-containing protein
LTQPPEGRKVAPVAVLPPPRARDVAGAQAPDIALAEALAAVHRAGSSRAVAEALTDRAQALVPCGRVEVLLVPPSAGPPVRAGRGEAPEAVPLERLVDGLRQLASPPRAEPVALPPGLSPPGPEVGGWLLLPVLAPGKGAAGALQLVRPVKGAFDEADVARLGQLVMAAGLALERLEREAPPAASERLRLLLESLAEGFLSLDARGQVLECNARAAALLGLTPEQLRGQEPWTAVPALMGGHLHERLMAALGERQPVRFLVALPPRTWLEVSTVPVGEELWVLATDITQREEAQALVAQGEERTRLLGERFQVALDAAQMAFWETNLLTGQVFRSQGHDRLYGYSEPLAEWTHEMFLASLHPEDRPGVDAQVAGIFSGQVGDYTSTYRTRWPDGSWHWLISRARVLRDGEGRAVVVRGALLDITALKETEQALTQAVRVRDDFLSLASHELKTPLTVLQLQLQALRKLAATDGAMPLSGPKVQTRLDSTERMLRRLGALVDNLLDVSRIQHGKLDFHFAEGDLAGLVSEVVARTEEQARQANVALTAHVEAPLEGHFDRLRLEQVLVNLLSNALRYGKGTPVEVGLERVGTGARLVVRDSGPGIPESERERVFDRFEQVGGAPRAGGLGLGLFIVRQIVEGHRGHVRVQGGPDGKGAAFVIELPLTPA